eukprot:CAMPEP_0206140588 /NCGR_PEP_ID=MMETSP1473-20131121/9954_1 /ASSEMBLY_ACC=CAM_ASM_001109 /TAXON_ID=1461547 /ORGANISM="Stichococcus sp, Strain RCC1054" /LENGTH=298 /DNA_ID=CAMNT_0053534787 /DNA_START=250 /DNA_END=1146 /DNA_ORIENTATION=+
MAAAGGGVTTADARSAPAGALQRQTKKLTYTSYEANSFKATFEQSGVTVLVDPWLVGDLTFLEQYWIYRGEKIKARGLDVAEIAASSNVCLITQGLEDHAHPPTLEALPRSLPIVAAPGAAAKCRQMGYTNVTELDHGQTVSVADGRLTLSGTQGALVGPPWEKRQLGVIFREVQEGGLCVYYEPHCDFVSDSVEQSVTAGEVDVVITPVVTQQLGTQSVGYPLVCGDANSVGLVKALRPKLVIPFSNAEIQASGPLSFLISQKGSIDGFKKKLAEAGLSDIVVQQSAEPPQPYTFEV